MDSDILEEMFPLPSLEKMARVRVVIGLWTSKNIQEKMKQWFQQFDYRKRVKCYELIESFVVDSLPSLHLPHSIEQEVSDIIRHIGLELFVFLNDVDEDVGFIRAICWTMGGRIDESKTDLELSRLNIEPMEERGAAELCLRDEFMKLWPTTDQDVLYNKSFNEYGGIEDELLFYWIGYARGDLHNVLKFINEDEYYSELISNVSSAFGYSGITIKMFLLAILKANLHAVKYFWQELTSQEKDNALLNRMSIVQFILQRRETILKSIESANEGPIFFHGYSNKTADTLCFFLSKLKGKELKEVLEAHGGAILKALAYSFPWQNYFLRTICFMYSFLKEDDVFDLLHYISNVQRADSTSGPRIFLYLYYSSPSIFKKSCIRHLIEEPICMLWTFFESGHLAMLLDVLEYVSNEDRKKVMNSFSKLCQLLRDNLHLHNRNS